MIVRIADKDNNSVEVELKFFLMTIYHLLKQYSIEDKVGKDTFEILKLLDNDGDVKLLSIFDRANLGYYQRFQILLFKEKKTQEEIEELKILNEKFKNKSPFDCTKDPIYVDFIRHLSKYQENLIPKTSLSSEEFFEFIGTLGE